jgi:hypothetical protein
MSRELPRQADRRIRAGSQIAKSMCCALRNGDSQRSRSPIGSPYAAEQLAIITSLAVAAEAAEQLAIMVAGRVALETTAQALLADEPAQSRDLGVGAAAALDENFQARP